jgi:hypothetical protein
MDIEKAKAIRSSGNWAEVEKELDLWVHAELQKTKRCSPDNLVGIQTTIQAFEKVKNLPTIVVERDE